MKLSVKIDQEDAISRLKKPYNMFSSEKEIIKADLVYLPYYVFESRIILGSDKVEKRIICVDTISGDYAFFEKLEIESKRDKFLSTNKIKPGEAMNIAKLTIQSNLMFEKGKGKKIKSINIVDSGMIEYPYWVGYFKRKNKIDFDVVDAINGKSQGAKMKPTFIKLIMQ